MFIIRADGNAKIGAGHLMRCLTIAQAVCRTGREEEVPERKGEVWETEPEILFLCADEDSAEMAREHGFRAETLHTDYRDMESELAAGVPRPVCPAETLCGECPAGAECAWDLWITGSQNRILVDSYYVTDAYLEGLKKYGSVFLMDDMQRHAFPVDGIINYNLFADREVYTRLYEGRNVQFCLGGAFIPLRQQFREVSYRVRDAVREVLLTTGGGDAENIAGSILDAVYREDITFHVLVGRFSPHFESWKSRAAQADNIRIHFDVKNMAELMAQCDLAITAGGSTVYELAAVGVPLICFSYAENQEALVEYIGREAVASEAGAWHRDAVLTLERMRGQFVRLCEDATLRQRHCDRERGLVDGRGAGRLAEILRAI